MKKAILKQICGIIIVLSGFAIMFVAIRNAFGYTQFFENVNLDLLALIIASSSTAGLFSLGESIIMDAQDDLDAIKDDLDAMKQEREREKLLSGERAREHRKERERKFEKELQRARKILSKPKGQISWFGHQVTPEAIDDEIESLRKEFIGNPDFTMEWLSEKL